MYSEISIATKFKNIRKNFTIVLITVTPLPKVNITRVISSIDDNVACVNLMPTKSFLIFMEAFVFNLTRFKYFRFCKFQIKLVVDSELIVNF